MEDIVRRVSSFREIENRCSDSHEHRMIEADGNNQHHLKKQTFSEAMGILTLLSFCHIPLFITVSTLTVPAFPTPGHRKILGANLPPTMVALQGLPPYRCHQISVRSPLSVDI